MGYDGATILARMLYLFVGPDTPKAKARVRKDALGEVVVVGDGGVSFEEAPILVSSQGLFSKRLTLLLDRPLQNAAGRALIAEHAELLHESSTDVYVVESELALADKKLFPKGVSVTEFGKKVAEERPLPFTLADAFLAHDRKRAWIEYQKLRSAGISSEEIHGTLSWAVRSALIASKTKSPDEAGLKPFVYTKSRRAAEKLGLAQVEELSRKLVALYHRARAGEGDMALGIERLLLEKA